MSILRTINTAVTIAALSCLLAPMPAIGAQTQSGVSTNTELKQATAALSTMLKLNGSVNYANPKSLTATAFESGSAKQTQLTINQPVIHNKAVAHVLKLSVDNQPLWHGRGVYLMHAQMSFREYLTTKRLTLNPVYWNNDFVVTKQSSGTWKFSDVLANTPHTTQSTAGKFDFAMNVAVAHLTSAFKNSLNRYATSTMAQYRAGRVQLNPYGYHYNPKTNTTQLYLFVHNGTNTPIYNLSDTISAMQSEHALFSTRLALPTDTFGVLMPGTTRFYTLQVPCVDIKNLKLVQAYPKNTKVMIKFGYKVV